MYGKPGIRLFPPRPGGHLDDNEFVIPSFTSGSKSEWSSRHYVNVLIEHAWVLSESERSFSSMMRCFQEQAKVPSLENSGESVQRTIDRIMGAETHGVRKQLRGVARAGYGERVDVSGLSSSGPPAAGVPHSRSPPEASPSGSWRSSSASWQPAGRTWEKDEKWWSKDDKWKSNRKW